MMGKLLKYDLRAMSRAFIPMWILAPVIALLFSFSIRATIVWADRSVPRRALFTAGNGILMAIMMIMFIAAIMGLLIMTVVFVIQRFWNGLLKEEGYLMFTLPVKIWELIVSKALTATLISCISAVVGVFSAMILAVCSTEEVIRSLAVAWKYVFSQIFEVGPVFWMNLVLFVIVMIVGMAGSIYHVYAAMAVGHLFQTHKVVGSCVSYIGFSLAVSILSSVVNTILEIILPDRWNDYWIGSSGSLAGTLSMVYLLYLLLAGILQIIIYHVITERLLATKLNLE